MSALGTKLTSSIQQLTSANERIVLQNLASFDFGS